MFINSKRYYHINVSNNAEKFLEKIENKDQINTVVLTNNLSGSNEELLDKILAAVKIQKNQYVKIDTSKFEGMRIRNFSKDNFTNVKHCLVFGLSPNQVGFNIAGRKYQIIEVAGIKVHFADTLDQLTSQSSLKKMLWNNLQSMYTI